jgi:hypothetical protein
VEIITSGPYIYGQGPMSNHHNVVYYIELIHKKRKNCGKLIEIKFSSLCQLHSYNKLVDVTDFQLVYWGALRLGSFG